MSLINDALKRAQQAQNDAPRPVAPGPPMRPAERAMQARSPSSLLLLPAVIVGLVVIALVLVWRSSVSSGPGLPARAAQNEATARTIPAPQPARVPQPAPAEKLAAQLPASAPATASRETAELRTTPPTAAPAPVPAASQALPPAAATTGIAVPVPSETPPLLRLQGIMFHPANPAV